MLLLQEPCVLALPCTCVHRNCSVATMLCACCNLLLLLLPPMPMLRTGFLTNPMVEVRAMPSLSKESCGQGANGAERRRQQESCTLLDTPDWLVHACMHAGCAHNLSVLTRRAR